MSVSNQQLAEIIGQLGAVHVVEVVSAAAPAGPPAATSHRYTDMGGTEWSHPGPREDCQVEECHLPTLTPPAPTAVESVCEPLDTTIKRVVAAADANSERSQQTAIGFSELGNPCDRFLAHKAIGTTPANTDQDNWLAIVGTAVHAWLEKAYAADNERLGRTRWVIEETVYALPNLYGHGDLFDVDLGAVIDHKILGVTKLRKIKKGEISLEYRVQMHLYGYGHKQAGREVREVILAVYPRNDSLRGQYGGNGLLLHREPYDEQIALDAVARWLRVVEYAMTLEVDRHPDRWPLIPATPGDNCKYCPFLRPGRPADDTGCPGQPVEIPTTMPGLIA